MKAVRAVVQWRIVLVVAIMICFRESLSTCRCNEKAGYVMCRDGAKSPFAKLTLSRCPSVGRIYWYSYRCLDDGQYLHNMTLFCYDHSNDTCLCEPRKSKPKRNERLTANTSAIRPTTIVTTTTTTTTTTMTTTTTTERSTIGSENRKTTSSTQVAKTSTEKSTTKPKSSKGGRKKGRRGRTNE